MKSITSTSQKIGWVVFAIGCVYMFGLGWMYSWEVVPVANRSGAAAYTSLLGLFWAQSVPLGAFVVAFDVQPDGSVRNQRNFARLSGILMTNRGLRSGAVLNVVLGSALLLYAYLALQAF